MSQSFTWSDHYSKPLIAAEELKFRDGARRYSIYMRFYHAAGNFVKIK